MGFFPNFKAKRTAKRANAVYQTEPTLRMDAN
jgi:hypothetical protein